jgi:hypothetical protein
LHIDLQQFNYAATTVGETKSMPCAQSLCREYKRRKIVVRVLATDQFEYNREIDKSLWG